MGRHLRVACKAKPLQLRRRDAATASGGPECAPASGARTGAVCSSVRAKSGTRGGGAGALADGAPAAAVPHVFTQGERGQRWTDAPVAAGAGAACRGDAGRRGGPATHRFAEVCEVVRRGDRCSHHHAQHSQGQPRHGGVRRRRRRPHLLPAGGRPARHLLQRQARCRCGRLPGLHRHSYGAEVVLHGGLGRFHRRPVQLRGHDPPRQVEALARFG
mmetsp:Transcript_39877/g.125530  ORF Transcript_39877/g.125530 Transcript_39877/m.125530 type:complete len:216 (-) Transcript_39877:758-1405(-)